MQAGNGYMSACNGLNAVENIKLQTVAWLLQAYNGILQLNNETLQANKDIDVVNNARLQTGNGGNSTNKGAIAKCKQDLFKF